MKNAHQQASEESQDLCDALFGQLEARIPDLRRDNLQKWCGFYQENHNRFAYINHRKTMSMIEVWCTGDPSELAAKAQSLQIKPRDIIRTGWEKRFQCRFFVSSLDQINEAAAILYQVSYRVA